MFVDFFKLEICVSRNVFIFIFIFNVLPLAYDIPFIIKEKFIIELIEIFSFDVP